MSGSPKANADQLIQIYIGSCLTTLSLKEFVVQIPGAESVKVSLESERWVFDRGQRCLPVYIPFTDQLNIIAIELWLTSSPVPVSVFPLELNDLQVGNSITHSLKWIDKGAIQRCNLVVAKAQIFTPNRFPKAIAYNKPNILPDFQFFISRCIYNGALQQDKDVSINGNAIGYQEVKSRHQAWKRNQMWNERTKLERLNRQPLIDSSLDLTITDTDPNAFQPLFRFLPIPLNASFATRGHFSVSSLNNDGVEAMLYLSISPIVDPNYESLLLSANSSWDKVQLAFHSIQIPEDSADAIFIAGFISTNIEEYRRKVDESLMLWPPFPVSKLIMANDQNKTVSLTGEDPSYRYYLSDPIEKLLFPKLSLSAAILDDKEVIFNEGCFIIAEIYSYPAVADLSPYLIGYCSMKLSDQKQAVSSNIHGCSGTLSWSAYRPNEKSTGISTDLISPKNELPSLKKSDAILRRAHRILHLARVPALRLTKNYEQESKLKTFLEEAQKELSIARQDCKMLQSQLYEKTVAFNALTDQIRDLEGHCEQLNNDKFVLETKLNQYTQLQETFLQNTSLQDTPLNLAQLQTLLTQFKHETDVLKRDIENKEKVIDSMKKHVLKSMKLQKSFDTLKVAHAAQTNYLQSIQEDRKKIDKFYKTIQYQEEVIINLEGLIRSCRTVVAGETSAPVEKSDDGSKKTGEGSKKSDEGSNWKERALNAEARCSALEGELRGAAEYYGKEIATLQTQLMEASNRPRSAGSTLSLVEGEDIE